jgi:hypothetical protein
MLTLIGMVSNAFVRMLLFGIKGHVVLLPHLFQSVPTIVILMVSFAHAMMDIINYGKDFAVNVLKTLFGMEVPARRALYVKMVTLTITPPNSAKLKESVAGKMLSGMEQCAVV